MTPCLLVTAIGRRVPEFASSTLMGELLDTHMDSAIVAGLLCVDSSLALVPGANAGAKLVDLADSLKTSDSSQALIRTRICTDYREG